MTPAEVPLSSSSSLSPSPAAPGRWQMNILPTRELKHDKTKKKTREFRSQTRQCKKCKLLNEAYLAWCPGVRGPSCGCTSAPSTPLRADLSTRPLKIAHPASPSSQWHRWGFHLQQTCMLTKPHNSRPTKNCLVKCYLKNFDSKRKPTITVFILNNHVIVFCPCWIITNNMWVVPKNSMRIHFL